MNKVIEFIKKWGWLCLTGIGSLILLITFAASEYSVNSAFLRIIYGMLTLVPVGITIPFAANRIKEK